MLGGEHRRLLQKSAVSQSCLQDCLDLAERMKREALRMRSEGSIPPYVTEAEAESNTAIRLYATVSVCDRIPKATQRFAFMQQSPYVTESRKQQSDAPLCNSLRM